MTQFTSTDPSFSVSAPQKQTTPQAPQPRQRVLSVPNERSEHWESRPRQQQDFTSPEGRLRAAQEREQVEYEQELNSRGLTSTKNPNFSQRQPMNEQTSHDDFQPQPIDKDQYLQQRKESQKQKSRLSPEVKSRISHLLGLSREFEDVEVDGVIFTLQSLKNSEKKQATELASQTSTNTQMFSLRNMILAFALKKVGGIDVRVVVESDDILAVYELIEELSDELVGFLYLRFAEMSKRIDVKLAGKTKEEQSKELTDQIKK